MYGPSSTYALNQVVNTSLDIFVQVAEETAGHLWVSKVRRCTWNAFWASNQTCFGPPEVFALPRRQPQPGDVYPSPPPDTIGVVAGEKTVTSSGVSVQNGWYSFPEFGFESFLPAATDMVATNPAGSSDLAMSFPGLAETHRNHDQGSYLIADRPLTQTLDWLDLTRGLGNRHGVLRICHRSTVCNGLAVRGANDLGQLGLGQSVGDQTDYRLLTLSDPVSVLSVGANHTVYVSTTGGLWGWGDNASGQLGDGTASQANTPRVLNKQRLWSSVAAGGNFTVAVAQDGTVWAAGNNQSGQLGNGKNTSSTSFVQVRNSQGAPISGFLTAYAGLDFACATRNDLTLWCWGSNAFGQLGRGDPSPSSNVAAPLSVVFAARHIALGAQHAIVLGMDNVLRVWGRNDFGQLGVGDSTHRSSATVVTFNGTANTMGVAASALTSYLTTTQGKVFATGDNSAGQLGLGEGQPGRTSFGTQPVFNAYQLQTGAFGRTAVLLNYTTAERLEPEFTCLGESTQGLCGVVGKSFYTPEADVSPFNAQ